MVALSHRHPAVGFFVFLLWLHSIPFLLRTLPRADMESAPTACQSRNILPAANFGGVGGTPPYILPKKGNVGRPALWPPCPLPATVNLPCNLPPSPRRQKPPLSKGGAELARRRDSCPPAGVTAHKAQPVGIPPSACGVHLPLTREAFLHPNLKLHFKFHSCKIWQSVLQSHSIPF